MDTETNYFAEVDFEAIADLGFPRSTLTETDWDLPVDESEESLELLNELFN